MTHSRQPLHHWICRFSTFTVRDGLTVRAATASACSLPARISFAMPFICIGPVCIPWTAVAPILIWMARPVWTRLPQPWRDAILSRYEKLQDRMQVAVWDRIGWKGKPKKKEAAVELPAAGSAGS